MKKLFKNIVLNSLIFLAKWRATRFGAKIIAITGTIGKTSTKEAITHILSKKFKILSNTSNYNTEFGVPLTILGEKSAFSNFFKWAIIIFRSFFKTIFNVKKFDFLILELGIDKPGDMDELLKIISPDVAIMTRLAECHLDEGQFHKVEDYHNEKKKLLNATLKKLGGIIIVNSDDEYQRDYVENFTNIFSYSQKNHAENVNQESLSKLTFTYIVDEDDKEKYEINAIGEWHIEIVLPAIMLAKRFGMSHEEIYEALKTWEPPKGRMNIVKGIKNTTILDSSYNASPYAVITSLHLLENFKNKRRVFVFGNMNELGKLSDEKHLEIGKEIVKKVDILITVGEGPKLSSEEAIEDGFDKESVFNFDDPIKAANFYKTIIEENDIILVKGSQNKVRLELFIKEIMKYPKEADRLLVRQNNEWKKK